MFEDLFSDNFHKIPDTVVLTLKCPLVKFPSLLRPDLTMKSCSRSLDGFVEIFITPDINYSCDVLDALLHELVHVVVWRVTPHLLTGYLSGHHNDPFAYVANCVGLFRNGKHTHDLQGYFFTIIEAIGNYPELTPEN
jgi:hypothetical protein